MITMHPFVNELLPGRPAPPAAVVDIAWRDRYNYMADGRV